MHLAYDEALEEFNKNICNRVIVVYNLEDDDVIYAIDCNVKSVNSVSDRWRSSFNIDPVSIDISINGHIVKPTKLKYNPPRFMMSRDNTSYVWRFIVIDKI